MIKIILSDTSKNCKHALSMCESVLNWFEQSGIKIESKLPLVLHFDDTIRCPDFISAEKLNVRFNCIRINLPNDTKWNQTLFQLSHEICHYVIYLYNRDNYHIIKWIEESICEAFSLYCLKYWSIKWNVIGFPYINRSYGKQMYKYRNDRLKQEVLHPSILDDIDMNTLEIINNKSENERSYRHDFMCQLTNMISNNSIFGLIDYQKYVISDILLDTEKYRSEYAENKCVNFICDTQNRICEKNI